MTKTTIAAFLTALIAHTIACEASSSLASIRQEVNTSKIIQQGPHHTVWSHVTWQTNHQGRLVGRTNSYTELGTGLNWFDTVSGAWKPSVPKFDLENGRAVARYGAYHMTIAPELRTLGGIEVVTPDRKKMRSHVLGLAYVDTSNGQSVMLAESTNCIGQLLPSGSEVLFQNAFSGIKADLVYGISKSGCHQDVVLRERPPAPDLFGLDPRFTRLEVLTEFVEAPEPSKVETKHSFGKSYGNDTAIDEHLRFGSMRMGPGKAFRVSSGQKGKALPVTKQLKNVEGRRILFEDVRWHAVLPDLNELPSWQASRSQGEQKAFFASRNRRTGIIPAAPGVSNGDREILIAAASRPEGFLLDYELVVSQDDFTFFPGTYHISSPVVLSGVTRIHGGAVIKSSVNTEPGLVIVDLEGGLQCVTEAFRPAVFTSKDDNSIGEIIYGSTGVPSRNVHTAVSVQAESGYILLHDLRISHASTAMMLERYAADFNLNDIQIIDCAMGVGLSSPNGGEPFLYAGNLLFLDIASVVFHAFSSDSHITAEHLTVFNRTPGGQLFDGETGSNFSFDLRNSLLSGLSLIGGGMSFQQVPASTFVSSGAGACYVTNNAYRDIGTTSIDAGLLARLRGKTVQPPVELDWISVTSDTTWSPQAALDDGAPDLGYHYDPLDYLVHNVFLSNATLNLTNGVVVGCVSGDTESAIVLGTDSYIKSQGRPERLNRIIRYNTVQECSGWLWSSVGVGSLITTQPDVTSVGLDMRWTMLSSPADLLWFYVYGGGFVSFTDCRLYDGNLSVWGLYPSMSTWGVTNCLLENIKMPAQDSVNANFFNCLFWRGNLDLDTYNASTFQFRDNFFYNSILATYGAPFDLDFNAYTVGYGWDQGNNGWWSPTTNDVVVSSFEFADGPLGSYYQQSTNLLNKGSRTASSAGLYHHTVLSSQQPAGTLGNGKVSMGFHYMACQDGTLLDTDHDSLPNYVEDRDGNGLQGYGETSFLIADSDYDGNTDGDEVSHLTNPRDPLSILPVQLAYFRFNSTNWIGEQGQLPRACSNVQQVTTWSGNGLQVLNAYDSRLAYNDQESNGRANINLRSGCVRFWFRPDWSSTNAGGSGPLAWSRLVELGKNSSGWGQWAIDLNPGGTQLRFYTSSNGIPMVLLTEAISWSAGQWYQITLNYGPQASELYINGTLAATGAGVQYWPNSDQRSTNGLMIGNDGNICQPAKGTFEEFETFNYQLTAGLIAEYYDITTNGDTDFDGMPDEWEMMYFGGLMENAEGDYDGDNLSNLSEFDYGSDPLDPYTFNIQKSDPEYLFSARLGEADTLVYLSNQDLNNGSLRFSISGGIVGRSYDLYFVNNLNAERWQWRRTYSGIRCDEHGAATFIIPKPDPIMGFFLLLDAADDDQDGLENGYETWFKYYLGAQTKLSNEDRDSDRLLDGWEVAYGLDPTTTLSPNGGGSNTDGDSFNNLAEFQANPRFADPRYDPLKHYQNESSRSVVSITSSDTIAAGPPNPASFTIHRAGGNQSAALTVYYAVGGDATYGIDYSLTPAPSEYPRIFSATIPPSASSVTVSLTPIALKATGVATNRVVIKLTPYSVCPVNQVQDPEQWLYVVNLFKDSITLGLNNIIPGVNGPVYAVKVYKSKIQDGQSCSEVHQVIVGGEFTQAGSATVKNIARLNLNTGQWEPLGNGVEGPVYAIEAVERFAGDTSPDLYVGGSFSSPAKAIAKWRGATSTWAAMGSGLTSQGFASDEICRVNTIRKMADNSIWIGGRFSYAGGVLSPNIAKWVNSQWKPVVQNVYSYNSQLMSSLGLYAGEIMVTCIDPSGTAIVTDTTQTSTAWSPYTSLSGEAYYTVFQNGNNLDLYGGGRSVINAGMRAVLDGFVGHKQPESSIWSPNAFETFEGNHSGASQLMWSGGWHLIGYDANQGALPPVDPSPWWPNEPNIPCGWKPLGTVHSIVKYGNDYYFGGSFSTLSGAPAGQPIANYSGFNRIYKWNTASGTWSKLSNSSGVPCVVPGGTGLNGTVRAMDVEESLCFGGLAGIWVGGNFTAAGEGAAWNIAFWAQDASDPDNVKYYWATPPTPTITSPLDGAGFTAPATVPLTVTFPATGCNVAKLEFYSNNYLIATLTSAPFSFAWTGAPIGVHTIRAVATDAQGRIAFANPVTINIHQ